MSAFFGTFSSGLLYLVFKEFETIISGAVFETVRGQGVVRKSGREALNSKKVHPTP